MFCQQSSPSARPADKENTFLFFLGAIAAPISRGIKKKTLEPKCQRAFLHQTQRLIKVLECV